MVPCPLNGFERSSSRLRRARHLKKAVVLCQGVRVKYAFIEKHQSLFKINRMCRTLGASRSGYYDGGITPHRTGSGQSASDSIKWKPPLSRATSKENSFLSTLQISEDFSNERAIHFLEAAVDYALLFLVINGNLLSRGDHSRSQFYNMFDAN